MDEFDNVDDAKISIHAPREGCDLEAPVLHVVRAISIHAPREGCDFFVAVCPVLRHKFQSTHPARGATG